MLDNDPFLASESDIMYRDCSEVFFSKAQSIGLTSGFGSDDPKQNNLTSTNTTTTSSGFNELNQLVPTVDVVEERKRRRMISNRDSARRSRMRKRKYLEKLKNEVNQLSTENQELNNLLTSVSHHYHCLRIDNGQVRSEYFMLQQKLSDMCRILMFKQLHQFTSAWA